MTKTLRFSEINKLAIPAIFAGIAEPLLSISDLAIIGRVPENPTETLAAVGIAGSFLSAMIWILAQMKSAISAIVSRYLGEKKLSEVYTLIPQALSIILVLSILLSVLAIRYSGTIFRWYDADGLIHQYACEYFNIRALGFPLTLLCFSIFGVFRGLQNTLWAMYISIGAAVLNISLDIVFVYGFYSIPAMGIAGAAYASLITQAAMLTAALYVLYKKTDFRIRLVKRIHPELKFLFTMGGNLFLRTAALNYTLYMANKFATSYGENFIAAHTIALNIWLFSAFFIDGYANAGNAIAGKLAGEKNPEALVNLSKTINKAGIGISLLVCIIFSISYSNIGYLFSESEEVLSVFASIFWLLIISQPINAIAFTMDGIMKGLGEAKFLRNLLVLSSFFAFTPLLFLLDYLDCEIYAIWTAIPFWMLLRAGGLLYYFRKKYLNFTKTKGI